MFLYDRILHIIVDLALATASDGAEKNANIPVTLDTQAPTGFVAVQSCNLQVAKLRSMLHRSCVPWLINLDRTRSKFRVGRFNTFTTNGLTLIPNEKYWLVLQPTSGTINWSWTNDSTHTGSGFLSQWAFSSDGGTTWAGSSTSPLQMSVITQ